MTKRDAKMLDSLRQGIHALEEKFAWEDAGELRRLSGRLERDIARRDKEAKLLRERRATERRLRAQGLPPLEFLSDSWITGQAIPSIPSAIGGSMATMLSDSWITGQAIPSIPSAIGGSMATMLSDYHASRNNA